MNDLGDRVRRGWQVQLRCHVGGAMAGAVLLTLSRFAQSVFAFVQNWPKFAALLLGIASATGFAPLGLWPVTFVAFAVLILLMAQAKTHRRAFGLGWSFGVGHFALGLNWIATAFTFQAAMPVWLGWLAVVLLSLYLAVYPALATWGAWAIATRGTAIGQSGRLTPLTLSFAGLWTVTEWLRSWMFSGFAWNPLGVVAVDFGGLPTVIGTYGISAIVILASGAGLILTKRAWRFPAIFAVTMALTIGGINFWSSAKNPDAEYSLGPVVTVVQPNVGQQDKWKGAKADSNFARIASLTKPVSDKPRLILWPEAAIPDYLETGYPWVYYDRSPADARARLTALMKPGDLMLLGALKLETDKSGEVVGARNAVMTVRPNGTLGPRYDKAHLVPYGEYLPMRPVLSAIGLSRLAPGDLGFWPGPGARTLDLGGFGKAGIQVCYEIIFSGQVVDRANRPDFIFNPSNDAWFGSWGPPQHLAQARLRAIEEGLPVVRATPTGISAIIDAKGRVIRSLPMGAAGRIDATVPPPHDPTLFASYGNALPLIFAATLLMLTIASARRRR